MKEGARERVLVTGGSGFIASHVVEVFREAGFQVATTLRSAGKGAAAAHYAARGVEVFEADLTRAEGWAAAVAGCALVIHVASPFQLNVKDGVRELIEPAVAGTRHVLEACAAAGPQLRRVVLTSSVAAVGESGPVPLTEEHWNEAATAREEPYARSKVEAERLAWSFVGQRKADLSWDLVVINPVGVFGPVLLPPPDEAAVNVSNQLLVKILNRAYPGHPNFSFTAVDVRDCARAHLLAATVAGARGRFIVCAGAASMAAAAGMLLEHVRLLPSSSAPFLLLFAGAGAGGADPSALAHHSQLSGDCGGAL